MYEGLLKVKGTKVSTETNYITLSCKRLLFCWKLELVTVIEDNLEDTILDFKSNEDGLRPSSNETAYQTNTYYSILVLAVNV